MTKTYIKVTNAWREVLRPIIKENGIWYPIRKIFIKENDVWRQVFGNTGITFYSTVGAFSFTVPAGINQIKVSYPTPTGIVTTTQSVSPGQVLTGTIGNFGSGSTFNGITAPAYSTQIFSFSGNVDIYDYFSLKIDTPTAQTFTNTGQQASHEAAATARGIVLDEYGEINQGDFNSTITVQTVPTATVLNQVRIVGAYSAGRHQPELVVQQPTLANNYTAIWTPNDAPFSSNAFYAYTITLQQIVPFFINLGGDVSLTSGSGTWTVPAGVYSVDYAVIGGGGGGAGGSEGDPYTSGGGGGGSGGIVTGTLAVTPGQVLSYTVGTGGVGGGNSAAGTAGTSTTLATITAGGGGGGRFSGFNTHNNLGGLAGSPGGFAGSDGNFFSGDAGNVSGGAGAGIPGFSTGGSPGFGTGNGSSGFGPGAGGGGGGGRGASGAQPQGTGGRGNDGIITLTY